LRVRRAVAAQLAKEREHALTHDLVHVVGRQVPEARPPEPVVRAAVVVGAGRENVACHRLPGAVGLVLLECLQVVESLDEDQVGDLLDNLERVRDAARPERVPLPVDLVFNSPVTTAAEYRQRQSALIRSGHPLADARMVG